MTASTEASSEASTAARGPDRRVPDFFIVGNPKSGTTALYEMLRRHPEIYMPDLKEPWFFATDMRPRFPPPRAAAPVETLDDYLSLFDAAGPEQRTGEATSSYLFSRTAAGRIAELRSDARIVAILREPASFLRSLHLQLLRTHVEAKKDLARAISLEATRRDGKKIPRSSFRPQMLSYSDHVRYVEQLRRYHAVFPAEQVLVLIYDDFRRDNEATVRTVCRFLEVDEGSPITVTDANPTVVRVRSQQLDDLVNTISVGRGPISRAVKTGVKALTPGTLRGKALQATQRHVVNGTPRPPDEALMFELRRRFKGEVVALSEYLGRDLVTLWGYDSIG
jgi:Sulfotransferase domain